MGDEDCVLTQEDMMELRRLLGKWISHIRELGRNSVLVNASEMTYAFINSTCRHMGLPEQEN